MITQFRNYAAAYAHPSAKRLVYRGPAGPVNAVEVDGTIFIENDDAEAEAEKEASRSKALKLASEVASKAAAISVASEVAPAPSELAPAPKPAPEPAAALDSSDGQRTVHVQDRPNMRRRRCVRTATTVSP